MGSGPVAVAYHFYTDEKLFELLASRLILLDIFKNVAIFCCAYYGNFSKWIWNFLVLHNFTKCFSVSRLNQTENVCIVNCLVSKENTDYTILTKHSLSAYFRKKGHARNFSEKEQIKDKKGKIFENLSKNIQNLKIFWKRAASCVQLSHVWNIEYVLSLPRIFICTTLRRRIFICIYLVQLYNKKLIVYQNTVKYTSSLEPT